MGRGTIGFTERPPRPRPPIPPRPRGDRPPIPEPRNGETPPNGKKGPPVEIDGLLT